jgi:hypothetical protein
MKKRINRQRLRDDYRHEGFYPNRYVEVANWDSGARIIRLSRRSKKQYVVFAVPCTEDGTIGETVEQEICHAARLGSSLNLNFDELTARSAAR